MELYVAFVGFFQQGGVFMYPIVIVLVFGSAVAIERYLYLSAAGADNRKLLRQLMPLVRSGKYAEAMQMAGRSRVAIGSVVACGLSQLGGEFHRGDVERAMEESLMASRPAIEKRTHYLATFASIATLLGLLGTIFGLIKAFTAVAAANPAEKADLLSASISVAMNTTAFGLMVAIPLLLAYTLLQSKATGIVDSLETAALKLLNAVTDLATPQDEA